MIKTPSKASKIFIALLLVSTLITYIPPAASFWAKDDKIPVINIDALTKRADVSPYTLGANHRHAYGGFGMFDTENQQVYPDFLEKTKEANLGVVRYPGGTIANLFTWKDTVGPLEERRNVVLGNSYESVFPYYGLDEHMQYTEAIGAEVVYMVGEAAETPEGAADLVEYLNGIPGENKNGGIDWAQKRADNGHSEPYGVTYFEIGNEMYLDNQQYWLNHPSALGDTDRARRYMQGDTIAVTGEVARKYGTWSDNSSDGLPNEEFYTRYYPAVEGTDAVYVNNEKWTRVDSFEGTSATDKVYTFEPKTGKITFGDGTSGMIPAKNAKIKVDYHNKREGFTAYYEAMKAVDPDIKIFANLPWAFNFVEGTKCDGIVYHNYFTYSNSLRNAEELHDAYMKMANDLVASIDNNVSQLRERTKRQDTIAAVTEFGSINNAVIYSSDTSEYGRDEARSLSRALSFAVTYMGSAKAESLIHIHQAYTAFSFGGGEKLPNADFVYNSMYSPNSNDMSLFIEGGTALAYKLIGNNIGDSYRNTYILNNPQAGTLNKYNALTSTVSVDSETGDLYLMVVNSDSSKDITALINLNGYTISGDARVQILNAKDITSCNTPDHPNAITISESTLSLGNGGSTFSYTFPAHSLVAIKISGSEKSAYTDSIRENFNSLEDGLLPSSFTATGNAAVTTVNGEKVLSITRSSSNVTLNVPLDASAGSVDGISRIRFKVSAKQSTNARLQVVLKSGTNEMMMFALEGGFVKNNAKIRAVYTPNQFHEFEIAIDNKSGQYVIYFDGSYIGSPGVMSVDEGGSQELVISAMTANGSFLIDDYSVENINTDTDNIRVAVSVDSVKLALAAGDALPLPEKVTVHYSNGDTEERTVIWDEVDKSSLATPGTFTVNGRIDGITITAKATVTVNDVTAAPDNGETGDNGESGESGDNGDDKDKNKGMDPAVIAGIAAGSLVLIAIAVLLVIILKKKKK